jgi:hypothetical protein
MSDQFLEMVRAANPGRKPHNLRRRLEKVLEEIGEIAEAHLNITSGFNGKQKTWADVREEIMDVLILAHDIALTPTGCIVPLGEADRFISHKPTNFEIYDYFVDNMMETTKYATTAFFSVPKTPDHYFSPDQYAKFHSAMAWVVGFAYAMVYTVLPGESDDMVVFEAALEAEMRRKLDKWADKMSRMENPTDDV